jgi:MFS family permease
MAQLLKRLNGLRTGSFSTFYYGWVIVGVAFVSMAFWLGIRTSFSVFYVTLLENFPWSPGASAGVQSIALLAYTILAPMVGGLIDRFGPRRIILPGILVLTLGLILCATIDSLAQFYILYGVIMGAGITSIGIVSYSAILAHWFEKKRGLANGIALSGMGVGTFVLVPLSQYLISTWGWRMTFIITGVLVLIILLPINGIFLRHKPGEVGQQVDGLKTVRNPEKPKQNPQNQPILRFEWTVKEALLSRRFWFLMAFCFFAVTGVYIVLVHNVRFMVGQEISKMTAALVLALTGIISSGFRIFWGWLSDHIGRESTFTIGILCACLGVVFLLLVETTHIKALVYGFSIFFGMGWGVTAPMFMSISADLFRGRTFGLIYGILEAGIGIAGALGAWLGGFIFDKTQSYNLAFILVIVSLVMAGFFVWLAAPRKFRLDKADCQRKC